MSSTIQRLQAHAQAAPAWLRRSVVAVPFLLPLVWVAGDDTPFDCVLASVTNLVGEAADLRHLTAYLLWVLALLIPAGLLLQVVGRARLRRAAERA